jgi:hypothetical protein
MIVPIIAIAVVVIISAIIEGSRLSRRTQTAYQVPSLGKCDSNGFLFGILPGVIIVAIDLGLTHL